jgi:hypothetical protein
MKKLAVALLLVWGLLAAPSAARAAGGHAGGFHAGGGWHGGGAWHGGGGAWHGGGGAWHGSTWHGSTWHGGAWHGGGWHGGWNGGWYGGWGGGVFIGGPWWWGFPYTYPYAYPYGPYGYYPPPYYTYPPAVGQGPSVYIQQSPAQSSDESQSGYWYYCASAKAYYPTVQKCREAWVKVPAAPD